MAETYSPSIIAKWLLLWASLEEEEAPVSNLKLQKLLYYAQGHHMARNNGTPLFTEPIEAWAHGPVVPSVYREYKRFGKGPIPADPSFTFDQVDRKTAELLASIWSTFGSRSAWKLREMTHAEHPWQSTFNPHDRSARIEPGKLYQYFAGLYANVVAI